MGKPPDHDPSLQHSITPTPDHIRDKDVGPELGQRASRFERRHQTHQPTEDRHHRQGIRPGGLHHTLRLVSPHPFGTYHRWRERPENGPDELDLLTQALQEVSYYPTNLLRNG